MLPLKDDLPTHRFPVVTVLFIAANLAAFFWQLSNPLGFEWSVRAYGAIPLEVLRLTDLPPYTPVPPPGTVLTSMFLHGSLPHLLFNMLFLWIFGNNVEDALGRLRYVVFYVASGVAAALAQMVVASDSSMPMVGASGAIAGVLGGYLVLFPRARVLTLIPIFVFIQFTWLPARLFLGLWFVVQFFSSFRGGPVAWYAHLGGFVAGVILVWLLLPAHEREVWKRHSAARSW